MKILNDKQKFEDKILSYNLLNTCNTFNIEIKTDKGDSLYSVSLYSDFPDDNLIEWETGVKLTDEEFDQLNEWIKNNLN